MIKVDTIFTRDRDPIVKNIFMNGLVINNDSLITYLFQILAYRINDLFTGRIIKKNDALFLKILKFAHISKH